MNKTKSTIPVIIIFFLCALQAKGVEIFSRKLNSESGLPDDNVRSIIQDSKGYIWMGTPGGLYRFDNYFYTTYKYSASGNLRLLNNNHITGLYNIPDDRLLIAEQGNKYSVFDVNQNKFVEVSDNQKELLCGSVRKTKTNDRLLAPFKSILANGGNVINDNLGNMAVIDNTGLLWFVDKNNGETFRMRVYDEAMFPVVNSKKYKVVTSPQDGLVWVSTNGCGITVYDRKARTEQHIRQGSGLISTDFILDMCMDKDGDVWVADEFHGVACLTAKRDYTTFRPLAPDAKTTRSNQVYIMHWMPDKTILIANTLGDVYKTDSRLQIPAQPTMRNMDVHALCFDRQGKMWVGTRQKGILTPGGHWLKHDDKDRSSVSADNIYFMLCDKKGRIWVAPKDTHLDLMVKRQDGSYCFRHFFDKDFSARMMLQDREGIIWVGAREGLISFSPDKLLKNPKAYTQVRSAKDLNYCDVSSIFEDSHGRLWIGTIGNGAYLIDKTSKENSITPVNGLVSNEVHSVIEDRHGIIWMGTNKGITCCNPANKAVRYYYDEYDLMRNFYSDNCACLLPDGRLTFGTNAGIVVYNPGKLAREENRSRHLAFTDLLVNGISVGLMGDDSPIDCSPDNVKELRLPHDENSLTVRFSMFNFKSATSTRYSYWLEGYDKAWSELSSYSFASYKKLPPGKYTLHVRAYDNDTFFNEERQLDIIIREPWWNTWWAYIIYIVLACAIGYVVFRQLRTVYRLRQRIAIENKLTEYKLQFFTNISHEFRTPLTIIRGAMQRINGQTIPAEMRQPISNMSRSVSRMLRLINQLLEFRKMQGGKLRLALEETDVVEFIKDIFLNFKDIADNKHITYLFFTQEKSKMVFIDRSHVDKIVYNILSNAFKYTPSHGEVRLTLSFHDDKMSIRIEDTGVGIPKEKQPELFQRFMQSSFSNDSIGIGLNLTKALVDVHHGSIRFEPNEPKGSIFTVELLTGKGVYKPEDFMPPEHKLLETENTVIADKYQELAAKPMNDKDVLIVEDESDVLDYVRGFMQKYFNVHTAMDGVEALQELETLHPDLIVSDIMMPVMDGLEFTARVRNIDDIKDTPIILLTALTSDEKRIKGMANGADAYITKPFDPQLLITTSASLIEKHEMLMDRYMQKTAETKAVLPEIITDERDRKLLDSMEMWIEGHIGDPLLSVDTFAEAMGYIRTNFYKKVKDLTGQSPANYIKTIRLNKAAELLKNETITVSEVCYKVGFSKPNYFAKVFKEHFGVSPKKYQQGTA